MEIFDKVLLSSSSESPKSKSSSLKSFRPICLAVGAYFAFEPPDNKFCIMVGETEIGLREQVPSGALDGWIRYRYLSDCG